MAAVVAGLHGACEERGEEGSEVDGGEEWVLGCAG